MKKVILAMLGILAIFQGEAITLPFEVDVPKVKFIRSKNGVNIRQYPSVNAKKFIADLEYNAEWGYGDAKWSSTVPKDYNAVQFLNGVSTQENDGWYFIENASPDFGEGGWVSAQYCEVFTPEPIEYPKTNYNSYSMYMPAIKWIIDKKDHSIGEYVLILEGHFGDNLELSIYLGKLVDGLIICPYEFPIELDWDSDFWSTGDNNFYLKQNSEEIGKDSNWYVTPPRFDSKYDWASYNISDSFVDNLLTKVEPEKLGSPLIYYLYNNCLYNNTLPGLSY